MYVCLADEDRRNSLRVMTRLSGSAWLSQTRCHFPAALRIPTVIGVTVRLSHLFLLYFLQIYLRSLVSLSDCHTYFCYTFFRYSYGLLVSPSDCHTYFYYTFSTYTYSHQCHRQTITPISDILSLDTATVIGVTVKLSHLFLLHFLDVYLRSLASPSDCHTYFRYTFSTSTVIGVTARLSHLFLLYFLQLHLRSLV